MLAKLMIRDAEEEEEKEKLQALIETLETMTGSGVKKGAKNAVKKLAKKAPVAKKGPAKKKGAKKRR